MKFTVHRHKSIPSLKRYGELGALYEHLLEHSGWQFHMPSKTELQAYNSYEDRGDISLTT